MSTLSDAPLPLPSPDRRRLHRGERALLVAACMLPWVLAWATPLYPPDEGRYGSVAAAMAEAGSWLVPVFEGRVHLTKPPLIYWLQGLGVLALGRTELAVRLPSLLATSGCLLVLFSFARTALGTRPAVIAVALTSVMPLTVVMGRLATTDATLALMWLVMIATAYRALAEERRTSIRPWTIILFWLAFALGLLTKGPAALGPLLILTAWQALAGTPGRLLRLRPALGFPAALAPLAAWGFLVASTTEGAVAIWAGETLGRLRGEGKTHPEPWWFYLPVALGGLYPATGMMVLPWLNCSWTAAWRVLRSGDVRALALIAVLAPLFGLSLSSGKLASYILPLAAPAGLLAAITIERWLRGEFDRAGSGVRPPDVRITTLVAALLIFVGAGAAAFALRDRVADLWIWMLPLAFLPLSAAACAVLWPAGDAARLGGLAIAWVGIASAWTLGFGLEARYVSPLGSDRMLARMRELFALRENPEVLALGFSDPTIQFYNGGRPTIAIETLAPLREGWPAEEGRILLVDPKWGDVLTPTPDVARHLEPVGTWTRWPSRPIRVFYVPPR